MRLAIFGCGYIYEKYKGLIRDEDEIVVFIDNDVTYHGHKKDGYVRIYPREIKEYDIDQIILMSDKAFEMREQLLRLSYPAERITHYREYLGKLKYENQRLLKNRDEGDYKKTMLIISNDGGPIVSYRTALVAHGHGYKVTIAASDADESFLQEVTESGIDVVVQENLEYSSEENLEWTKGYDVVLVNTFPMILCAIKIAKHRKVHLWLHESPFSYQAMEYWHDEIQQGITTENIIFLAVTDRAKENLLRFYVSKKSIQIMSAPILDYYNKDEFHEKDSKGSLAVFLSGVVTEGKGFGIALDAIDKLNAINDVCLYMVGKNFEDDFVREILGRIEGRTNCYYLGETGMKETMEMYSMMDVIIVPSQEESFSMVAAEGMMMGKTCIVSDHCGIAEYIENGVNGFVFSAGDADALAEILMWCMGNREELGKIGKLARETYKSYFSYEIFSTKMRELFMSML